MINGGGEIENKAEYRVWNAFKPKLGPSIIKGIDIYN
jgi:fibrillarin-like rRNA methylase